MVAIRLSCENWGALPQKILGAKNGQNLVQFWMTSNFFGQYFHIFCVPKKIP